MTTPHESLSIENVVASTGIDQELDLEHLATDLSGAEFDPERFPGLVYRITDPTAATLIFRSGKIISTGGSSVEAAKESLEIVFSELRSLGIDVPTAPTITVQNIVTSADLGDRLNLHAISIGLGLEDVEYEPEQFPGLVYRIDDPDVVVLLFGSGKAVITGATEPGGAGRAVDVIADRLADLGLLTS